MNVSQAIKAWNVNLRGLNIAERIDFVDGVDETLYDVVGCLNIVLDIRPKAGSGVLQELVHLNTNKSIRHPKKWENS